MFQNGTALVALVQEPYFHKGMFYLGNLINPNFTAFSKDGMTNAREMPRACILINSALNAKLISELTTRDICTIEVTLLIDRINGNEIFRKYVYCSAYCPYEHQSPTDDLKKVVSYCDSQELPLILGCDANAHHIIWGSSDINRRGSDLMEYLSSTNLEILNVSNNPTFVRSDRTEVIDITLCSSVISQEIANWHVPSEESLSDHRFIYFEHLGKFLNSLTFRNPRSTNWDLYQEYLATRFQGYVPEITTPYELDEAVETTTELIVNSYKEACPLRTINVNRKSTPWWNTNLAKLRKECRRSWNRRRTAGFEAFKAARRAYRKATRAAERSSWKSYCTDISGLNEVTRLNKVLAKSKDHQVSNLKTLSGEYILNDKDNLVTLFDTHFPGSIDPVSSDDDEFFSASLDSWQTARSIITTDTLKWAIDGFAPYKSPGMDEVFPILLQKGFEYFKFVLRKIMISTLATGYIPKLWRQINVKFIPKGGRQSYDEAKSFRPISLSSFLLKTLERIIDHLIRDKYLTQHPLHATQHAYQTGKSTTTLLHNVVHNIENAFSCKQSCLGAFLDIEGAFDNASFTSIVNAAQLHGVPLIICNWINSMLSNRHLNSSLRQADIKKISTRGCPQGGVLSPLLWNLVADGLLEKLNDRGIPTYGFADDYLLLIKGICISTLFDIMQQALRSVERWCSKVGLSVNPLKTNIILFTKKRILQGVRPLQFYGSEIHLSDEVKYLGVILDSKLSWSAHVGERIKKACMAFGQCRRAIGKKWGLKPKHIHWIYTTIVRPILAYGCLVWWQKGEVVTVRTKLNHLQRMCLLGMSGAFTTTPTAALEALFCIKPLHIFLEQEALSCAFRLKATGLWMPYQVDRYRSHSQVWSKLVQLNQFHLAPSDLTLACSSPSKEFSTRFPSRQEWLSGSIERELSNQIVCYTDGSLSNGRAGAGIYCHELGIEHSQPLGRYCTVFQSELYAIMYGVQIALQRKIMFKNIYFCSDSQAAIKSLSSSSSRSKLVIACRQHIVELAESNGVFLLWVPGHEGIFGNECADELARAGSDKEFCGPEPAVPISPCWVKQQISSWACTQHERYWEELDTCRQTKTFIEKPSIIVSNYLLTLSKSHCSSLIRALTGHCKLNYHLHTIQRAESSLCTSCESDVEDSFHLVCNCPSVAQLRFRTLGYHVISESEYKKLNLKDILSFLTQCGKEL